MATTDYLNANVEVDEETIASQISQLIEDEHRCISVKINYCASDMFDPNDIKAPDELASVLGYFRYYGLDVVMSTAGVHINGEAKRPHLHYHLIVRSYPTAKTFRTNQSTHRSRWRDQPGNEIHSFANTSITFPEKEEPVWQHLAYPLKEGIPIKKGVKGLTPDQFRFLKTYGENLYQVSLGNNARKDACLQRKKVARDTLRKVCEAGVSNFSNYREMVKWLDDNYIAELEFDDYPDPKNYKTNCQQIAVKLGKLKYSDMV